jgi:ribosomal protein L40E
MSSQLCLRCGASNPTESSFCARCGMRMSAPGLSAPDQGLQVEALELRLAEVTIACDKYRNEELTNEDFYGFLVLWGRGLTRPRSQNIMITDETDEAETLPEDAVEVDPNFEHFADGLKVLMPVVEDGDLDRLDRGLAIMKDGNRKLLGLSNEDYAAEHIDSVVAKVICVVCSTSNSASDSNCGNCGAKLPRVYNESQGVSAKPINGRYEQFKKACDSVLAGKTTMAEFAEFLEQIQETLRVCREGYDLARKEYCELSEGDEPIEEVELCCSGMDDFEAGIEELWGYVDTGAEDHIHSGLALIERGKGRINEARTKNRQRRAEMADEFGYV